MASMEEIESRVAEIERRFRRLVEVADSLGNRTVTMEINGQLGELTVTAQGDLVEIRLDPEALRFTTESALAAALVSSISAAEERARQERDRAFDEGAN